MRRTKSKPSRPKLQSHFKIEEVTMKPLNETLSNSHSNSTAQPTQPMFYHDIDLASLKREDVAKKAKMQTIGPTSINEEITYPRVSHGKSLSTHLSVMTVMENQRVAGQIQ